MVRACNIHNKNAYVYLLLGTDLSLKNTVAKFIAKHMPNENISALPQELIDLIHGWRF